MASPMMRFFRPMGFNVPMNLSFESDTVIIRNFRTWLKKIKLGGVDYSLEFDDASVFQIASQSPFLHKYGIYFFDQEVLAKIIKNSDFSDNKFKDKTINQFLEHKVMGFLTITKYVRKGKDTRYSIQDLYRLSILTDKFEPVCVVLAFETVPFYLSKGDYDLSDFAEFFPEPDWLVVDWHEAQLRIGRPNNGIYSEVCCSLNDVSGTVFGKKETTSEFIYSKYAIFGNQRRSIVDTLLPNYVYRPWELMNYDNFTIIPLVPSASRRGGVDFNLPRPRLIPGSIVEQAIVKFVLLHDPKIQYLGNGFFAFTEPRMTDFAAGTGNWGSAEMIPFIEVALGGKDPVMGSGIAVASASAVLAHRATSSFNDAERLYEAIRRTCYEKASTQECLDCFEQVISDFQDATTGGTAASIGAGIATVICVIGAVNAWNVVGWISLGVCATVAVAAAIIGGSVANDASKQVDDIYEHCQKNDRG